MSPIPLRKALSAPLACAALLVLPALTVRSLYAQTDQGHGASDRPHVEEILRGLNRGRSFGQVAISPDGNKLAWIEGGRGDGEIRVASPKDRGW